MLPSGVIQRLKRLLIPGAGTEERIIKSGAWNGATNALNRLLQLLKFVILARFLSPTEFGLIGLAFLVITSVESFTELGLNSALIQRKEDNIDYYLNTAWVLRLTRGVGLCVIIVLLAPYVAIFFNEPRASDVVRVIGLSPLILGFRNPAIVYFEKNLQFHKRFIQHLSGTSVNFVIAVGLGVTLQNVWALVLGSLGGNITSLLISYILHSYRPKFRFEIDAVTDLIDYSKWIFVDSIFTFLMRQGDDAFVGWFLNATSLGFYQMAYRFSNAPATEISSVISGVAFPSYSKVQNDPDKLRNGFYRTVRISSFASFPAAIGIMSTAPTFVRGVLGEQWIPIIPIMQLLAVWGLLRSVNSAATPVFNATGRPDVTTKIRGLSLLVIAVLIFPAAARYGLIGVAGVIVISSLCISVPIWSYIAIKTVEGSVIHYLHILSYPLLGSVVMGGIIWAIQMSATSGIIIVDLLIIISLGVVIYLSYTVTMVRIFNYQIGKEISNIITHLK